MIQDVVLHVFQVNQKYDAAKAKESTWIQHITDNKCLSILSYYQTQYRASCETISLDASITTDSDQTVLSKYDDANRWRQSQSTQEIREAKEAVEKVIELGSDSVRDFLEKLLSGGLIEEVPAYSLQALAKRCSATLKDFELVFRYASGV